MRIYERIMKVRRGVVFQWQNGLYGSCYPTVHRTPIVINLEHHWRCDPLSTYIHECIHIIFPKLSERNVRKVERYVWGNITPKEQFFLAKKLYNRKWRAR
jgi:hypothetical protein